MRPPAGSAKTTTTRGRSRANKVSERETRDHEESVETLWVRTAERADMDAPLRTW